VRDGREWVERGCRRNESSVGDDASFARARDASRGIGRGDGRLDVERRLGRENNKNEQHLI
jgi:hypothetical protein